MERRAFVDGRGEPDAAAVTEHDRLHHVVVQPFAGAYRMKGLESTLPTKVRPSFLPYHQPLIESDDEQAVLDVLRSGWLTTGPQTKTFERTLAEYVGAARAVAVNSCTAALHLALKVAGVGPGDEVITSPITFASTANVIVHCGATPVFVDVDPVTLNIDPTKIEAALTPRTKAVIPVDFAGHPADLDAIAAVVKDRRITVIEDAAHSIGAEYGGRRVGGIADMTAFSFYATKNITSGEGGALTTNNEEWAERASIMALHGISRDAWKRYGNEATLSAQNTAQKRSCRRKIVCRDGRMRWRLPVAIRKVTPAA